MLRSLFRCWRTALAWATLLALLSIAWDLKHPPLYKLRACETALLLADAAKPAGGQCRHSRRRDRQASKGLRLTSEPVRTFYEKPGAELPLVSATYEALCNAHPFWIVCEGTTATATGGQAHATIFPCGLLASSDCKLLTRSIQDEHEVLCIVPSGT